MAGRVTADGRQHHCAKYSTAVLGVIAGLLDRAELERPIVDPFAGTGERLAELLGRSASSWFGIELEREFAEVTPAVRQGDAMEPSSYPPHIGTIVTSPTYGNRMADTYLGPTCPACDGTKGEWEQIGQGQDWVDCDLCHGVGKDPTGRQNYAISLGRRPSPDSSASMQWGPKYWAFHGSWLRLMSCLLPAGERRLVLNVSDFNAAKERVHAVDWWVGACRSAGFVLDYAEPARTGRLKHNHLRDGLAPMVSQEVVMVFGLPARRVSWTRPHDGATWWWADGSLYQSDGDTLEVVKWNT